MRGGNGGFFAAGSLPTRAKKATLQICRPEIACDFRQICQRDGHGGGSRSPAIRLYACAWHAVMATVATISSALQPRDRSLQGLAMPCRMGP